MGEPETHAVVEMISDFNIDMGQLSQNMIQISEVMNELQGLVETAENGLGQVEVMAIEAVHRQNQIEKGSEQVLENIEG